ncbi:MAG: hypothetical protein IPJ69_14925 [Deltaproteobacteria bacterium]|nr:MAG: hypothetical protein IPJ69_14925 [Deltaproteobacteria bacterium]
MSGPNVSATRPTAPVTNTAQKSPTLGAFTGAVAQLQRTGAVRAFPQPSTTASNISAISNAARV